MSSIENIKRLYKFGGITMEGLIDQVAAVLDAQNQRIADLEKRLSDHETWAAAQETPATAEAAPAPTASEG